MSTNSSKEAFLPGSDADPDDIFNYPFTMEDNTIEYIRSHKRIMFIIRGPAGTGKDSLAAMLTAKERYPSSVICSADHYFRNTFSSERRDPKSLSESHMYCQRKVETSCQKGAHPIIIKNTHIKKFEMQKYLDLAAEFNYTVVMASTKNKFLISPEILAKSNTKGLNVEYFMRRLKQWEDILPILVGWMISPGDASFLLNELQIALDYLLGDGKFCRILNVFEKEKLLQYYQAKRLLYCLAACSKSNNCFDLKKYYGSSKVQEYYGQCFTINIQGFLVTPFDIVAIVLLDETMRQLHQNEKPTPSDLNSLDSITDSMQSFRLSSKTPENNFDKYSRLIPFKTNLNPSTKNTAVLQEWKVEEDLEVQHCSFIHLARSSRARSVMPWKVKIGFLGSMSGVANAKGFVSIDQFGELEKEYRSCRLPKNAWLLRLPYKISVKSVFTGMYV